MMYTFITIGLFAAFFLAVILPIRRYAKRKGYKRSKDHLARNDWFTDPGNPQWYVHFNNFLLKKW